MEYRDNIRVLLYSYYTTIAGWGVLLRYGLLHVGRQQGPVLVEFRNGPLDSFETVEPYEPEV